ncbi:MAG TPA: prolipoprotein diacylglyceryl transferase [Steroidobacteraceae bacterium]|nr:prolipoprotein diacylglyceryl transferase [Steroidobacteraceae bacterium]
MLQYPGFNPVAVELGPIKVHWYGIMYLIGFAAAWWLARVRARAPNSSWKPLDVDDLIFFCMMGVIFGGRTGYVLFYGTQYWAQDPWYPLKVWEGGMSFHGALLGTLVTMAMFAWRRKRRITDVFDFAAPLPELGLFFGRIGNFINGELWGKPTTVPWGFRVDGQVRHASQLYEAGLEGLVLFAVMWIFTRKPRPRLAPSGLFLLLYGLARFCIEFVRVPDANLGYLAANWVTMGQILSLPMILGGIILLVIAYRRRAPSGNFLESVPG